MLMLWAYLELAARAARRRRRASTVLPAPARRSRCACTRCAAAGTFILTGPITPGDATVPRGNRRWAA